jgi:hypothetical protein
MFERRFADVGPFAFESDAGSPRSPPQPDEHVAAAGSYVQQAQRSRRRFSQLPDRGPENARTGAEDIDAAQAIESRVMALGSEAGLVHQFRFAITEMEGREQAAP